MNRRFILRGRAPISRVSRHGGRIAALAMSLAACDAGSTAPDPFGGTYSLRTSNGVSLPAPYAPGGAATIQRGNLTVVDPERLSVTLGLGLTAAEAADQTFTFRYQRVGDSLVISTPIGSGGRVSGSSVRLQTGFPAPPSLGFNLYYHDLTFRR